MKKSKLCLVFVFLFALKLSAQNTTQILDEIFVTSSKFDETKQNVANVVFTITKEVIEENQGKTVIDLLNSIAGIEIRGANTNSTEPRSLFVRGGRSRQILVMIDGVVVTDPSLINQEFDLRFLALNQIERIEIVKGGTSTLYGSGAATGVINIILKKDLKNSISGNYQVNIGSNSDANSSLKFSDFRNQNVQINANLKDLNILAAFNMLGTDGMSSAKSNTNTVFENDAYYAENVLLKLNYKPSKLFSIESFLNYDAFTINYDAGIFEDSQINNGNQDQLRFGFKPSVKYNKGEFYILASLQNTKRIDNNFSTFSNSINSSTFEGRSLFLDAVNKFNFNSNINLVTGFNYQHHSNNSITPFGNINRSVANFSTSDPYLMLNFNNKAGYIFNLGSRLNIHSNYGNHFVYDVAFAKNFNLDDANFIKGIINYSTAFIAPSTYQLFSDFGNLDLQPETIATFEVGFETQLNKVNLNLVYFNRVENNAIIFQSLSTAPFGRYINGNTNVDVSGLEAFINVDILENLKLTSNYTYTNKTVDADYIPKTKINTQLNYDVLERLSLIFNHRFVSERSASFFDTTTFTTQTTNLESYQLFDVTAGLSLLPNIVDFTLNVSNLFNEDFQDVLGYSTRGRNVLMGLQLNF